jgi:hypothetical protein
MTFTLDLLGGVFLEPSYINIKKGGSVIYVHSSSVVLASLTGNMIECNLYNGLSYYHWEKERSECRNIDEVIRRHSLSGLAGTTISQLGVTTRRMTTFLLNNGTTMVSKMAIPEAL